MQMSTKFGENWTKNKFFLDHLLLENVNFLPVMG